jgi:hypothetical protein
VTGVNEKILKDDYLYRDVPALGPRVFQLGLATNFGVEGVDLEWALEQGVDYIFWPPNARRIATRIVIASAFPTPHVDLVLTGPKNHGNSRRI